ncbi:MAG: hypothetical protein CL850_04140 [Crocinitomicaceae bacterium]|nr:hypothetical protein [Crocinitomicaceae bacterium]
MMNYKYILLLILCISCLYNCTKDTSEGPSLNDLYGDFNITDSLFIVNNNPDFASGEVVEFNAAFSLNVKWKITITGEVSGAEKIIESTNISSEINSDNASWNGNTTSIPFFQAEKCMVELSFPEHPNLLHDSLIIQSPKSYQTDGIIIADFENGELPEGSLETPVPDGGNMTFRISNPEDIIQDAPLEGNYYYKLGGKVNWDWSLGYIDIPLDLDPTITSNPTNFFLNIGVLSDTENLHMDQFLNILVSESDIPFNDNPAGGADIFGDDVEVYKTQIRPVNWDGWRFFSISYDEFEVKNPNAPGVINDRNPQDIKGIRIACQACPSGGQNPVCPDEYNKEVRTDIDFVIFTENEPLIN